jgi:hypothetical protein
VQPIGIDHHLLDQQFAQHPAMGKPVRALNALQAPGHLMAGAFDRLPRRQPLLHRSQLLLGLGHLVRKLGTLLHQGLLLALEGGGIDRLV